MLELLMTAKAKQDEARNALISQLAHYELPDELKALLSVEQTVTSAFHEQWMSYQVAKAVAEAK